MNFTKESSEAFTFVHVKLNKMLVYFNDKSKQSPENLSRAFQVIFLLWDQKVTQLTTFSERGKLLILVIRFFYQIQSSWHEIRCVFFIMKFSLTWLTFLKLSSVTFLDKILNEYTPKTLQLITVDELQDQASLILLQESKFEFFSVFLKLHTYK